MPRHVPTSPNPITQTPLFTFHRKRMYSHRAGQIKPKYLLARKQSRTALSKHGYFGKPLLNIGI